MCYEDNVLIKLRRDYSKDEVVMHALNVIKELQIERGKNSSYIEELLELIKQNEFIKETVVLKSTIKQLKTNIIKLNMEIKNIKKPKDNDINLLNKIEKYKKASIKKEVNLNRQRIRINELNKENSRLKCELMLFGRNTYAVP